MNGTWWSNGIPFSCQSDCGKCCDEPGGIVYLHPNDAIALSTHLNLSVEEWLDQDCRKTIDGRYILNSNPDTDVCIYLDENKKCVNYQVRPMQCRSYPFWGENVRSIRSWTKTVEECPGLSAEDAIIIDGDSIRMKIINDRNSTRGFRHWPV